MNYVALMEVVQTFQDLDDITGYKALVEFSKGLQSLAEGAILGVPTI